MISRKTFVEFINTLCNVYEKDITKERAKIYYDALKNDFTDNDITNALPKILQKSRFFPTITDLAIYYKGEVVMEDKVEKLLIKRSKDVGEEWKDFTKWKLEKCESPIEKLFLIEWIYRIEHESHNPEGLSQYYIYPQFNINNKYRIDFLVAFITENENLSDYRNNFINVKHKTLIIELDSYLWHGSKPEQFTKEKERERYLIKDGWNIMRFSGSEIYRNVEKCVAEIINYFEEDDKNG